MFDGLLPRPKRGGYHANPAVSVWHWSFRYRNRPVVFVPLLGVQIRLIPGADFVVLQAPILRPNRLIQRVIRDGEPSVSRARRRFTLFLRRPRRGQQTGAHSTSSISAAPVASSTRRSKPSAIPAQGGRP